MGTTSNDPLEERRNFLVEYFLKLLVLVVFLTPAGYVSVVLTMSIHEVLGHGLTAILLGGSLDGFVVNWDGTGLAQITLKNMTDFEKSVVAMAGIFSTIIAGVLFLKVGTTKSLTYFGRLAALIIAMECLVGGTVYLFWNAAFEVGAWDVTIYLDIYDAPVLKWFLILIGGVLMVGSLVAVTAFLYRAIMEWLDDGFEPEPFQRIIPLLLLGFIHISRWATFGLLWDIGPWAILVMTILTVAILTGIHMKLPDKVFRDRDIREAKYPTILVFALAVFVGLFVFLLF